jgi:uncharacterized protein (TIGR03000 family)
LPAGARLTIDGRLTQSTSSERWFVTPPLESGKTFAYTLQADFVREGKTVTVREKVAVQPGRETSVSLGGIARPAYSSSADSGETRAYYFSPQSPETGALVPSVRVYQWPPSGARDDPSLRPGIHAIHWGRNPGDTFYYNRSN